MSKNPEKLTPKLLELIEKNPAQMKQLPQQLGVNRAFLTGYLKALESQGYVRAEGDKLVIERVEKR
jgi:DNA-binding IclR family transcriptional regulator